MSGFSASVQFSTFLMELPLIMLVIGPTFDISLMTTGSIHNLSGLTEKCISETCFIDFNTK